ncbi:hypothetical protein GWI33_011396 [Rhynchophorus ferrugineus]|uniref:Uncharacterized protein n=1 Tax=Rhynchophorus ferrugineus TaxID=354439 RepID=A0A834J1M5_RHYFE|nr:hypothetical protein GWI33_011396 [Rhynchophorus ferrugineus]
MNERKNTHEINSRESDEASSFLIISPEKKLITKYLNLSKFNVSNALINVNIPFKFIRSLADNVSKRLACDAFQELSVPFKIEHPDDLEPVDDKTKTRGYSPSVTLYILVTSNFHFWHQIYD